MKSCFLLIGIAIFFVITTNSCGKGATSIYINKGKDYYKKENYQMAIRFFEKAIQVDSSLEEAKYYRALCYYGLGHNHHACEEMAVLMKNGYKAADSTLKNMGCYYFPEKDTLSGDSLKN